MKNRELIQRAWRQPGSPRRIILLLLIGLSSGLGGGGCAAAGLAAAGPMLAALQFVGDRSLERTLPADLTTAWAATVEALTRMEIRVHEVDRSGESWLLNGTGDAVTIHAKLTRVLAQMTRLSLRVEAGRLLADKQTAAEIGNQVASVLASRTPPAGSEPSAMGAGARAGAAPASGEAARTEALVRLEGEIRRLRSEIAEGRAPGLAGYPPKVGLPPRSPGEAEPIVSRGPGILMIPLTDGVPILPRPTGAHVPAVIPTLSSWTVPAAQAGAVRARGPAADNSPAALVAPLSPVDVLTPVPTLLDRQSVR